MINVKEDRMTDRTKTICPDHRSRGHTKQDFEAYGGRKKERNNLNQ